MEMKPTAVLGLTVVLMLVVQALASPLGDQSNSNDLLEAEKRPKYMDTRELTNFKQVLLVALEQLVKEDVLSPAIFEADDSMEADDSRTAVEKRRRAHLGLCLRRTSSGVHPIPCWKKEG